VPVGNEYTVPVPNASETATAVVPRVIDWQADKVDKEFSAAGLVPILRYEPGIVTSEGTVVNTEPPVGSTVALGSTVIVVVAGPVEPTLARYVDAHRETFVGYSTDTNGVAVVAVYQKADLTAVIAQLNTLAKGKPYRMQSCARSWAELQRVQIELSRRDFVPGAQKLAYGMSIDPLACAVRLTVNLSDAQIAELSARYQGALVIQKGDASRLPRR
jgi:hypothetical protein